MQGKISRRKLANHVVSQIKNGILPKKAVDELAAYLISTNREREQHLIVRMILDQLEASGTVVANITTASPLSPSALDQITSVIKAEETIVKEVVDPSVIGGFRLETPSSTLDTTVAHNITRLKSARL